MRSNFELAIRQNDPNAREVLLRSTDEGGARPRAAIPRRLRTHPAAVSAGITTTHLQHMADIAFEWRNGELGRAALEHALSRLMQQPDPKDLEQICLVLRQLVRTADSRKDKRAYFQSARQLLGDFSAANCPLKDDTLRYLQAETWNIAMTFFNERALAEAEGVRPHRDHRTSALRAGAVWGSGWRPTEGRD